MEWLVNCDIESEIAFLQQCPNWGERRSMREKGIDGRHAEADSLGLGLAADLLQFRVLRFRFF